MALFDQDITYLNGKEIGHTYYQYPPRRYDIPEGLLKEGDNVIAVRFINKYGMAHFIPEKPYLIAFGEDRFSQNPMPKDIIPLSQTWKMHVGAEMPSCPSGDISLQNQPTTLYNAVVHPLAPYSVSGVVWYQGESNTGNPATYTDYLKKMMGCWRDLWQQPQMPFCIVQLANHDGVSRQDSHSPLHILRIQSGATGHSFVRHNALLRQKTHQPNLPSSTTLARPSTSIPCARRRWPNASAFALTAWYIIIKRYIFHQLSFLMK